MLGIQEKIMRITYFEEIDTALVELSDNPSVETREPNENMQIEIDNQGYAVRITIEHASKFADMQELVYQLNPQVYRW